MPDGAVAAAALFVYDRTAAYYLAAGTDPELRETGAGTSIVLAFIERAIARGLHGVDVCGINSPQRGDFKTSFNALPVPYFLTRWH
jgi:lipid II:glycine glycyltransferase (peptidoglycan interpeptide bridge formation enzyme)